MCAVLVVVTPRLIDVCEIRSQITPITPFQVFAGSYKVGAKNIFLFELIAADDAGDIWV